MTNASGVNSNSFSPENYQARYSKTTIVIQVVLGILAVTGATVAILARYKYLDHKYIKIGTIGSISSALLLLGVAYFGQKNNLKAALYDAKSFEDLQERLDGYEARHPSFFTISYLTNCMGATIDGELASKKIRGIVSQNQLDYLIETLENKCKLSNPNFKENPAYKFVENLSTDLTNLE